MHVNPLDTSNTSWCSRNIEPTVCIEETYSKDLLEMLKHSL